ncbi:MAG: phage tail protein [Idiomarina sp.]|nr:phage tail protein [Idiomarina sp.]
MHKSAEGLYNSLEGKRYQYLDRARSSAKLTLPYVMPDDGFGAHSRLDTPFQGIGARGVNNLASKLLLALLPPNAPFFRLAVDEYGLAQEGAPPELVTEIETSLQQVEESFMEEVSRGTYRTALHEALKQLIITGNALLYVPDDGGIRVFHLDRFCVERDPMGNVLSIATKESLSYMSLTPEMKEVCGHHEGSKDEINLYTAVCRQEKGWKVWQEINGNIIPKSEGFYGLEKNPFIPLRFTRIDGEDYGRGYVEEYLGDLQSLEALTQAIVEGSAAASKVLFLVNPNGTTRAKTLADSPNGAITQGNAQDVTTLQVNKFNDFRVAQETINVIKDRLGHAFLLTSGTVRQAERVTAEEIRMLGMELESALGGLYSLLSSEMQLPLVNRLMEVMNKKNKLPKIPKDVVKPIIITGVEALGRGNDLQKLDLFLAGAAQVVGPQAIAQFVKVSEYFKRRAISLGIKTDGLVKSDEEMAMEAQQMQQMQMAEKLGPAGIKAVSDQVLAQQEPTSEV